MNTLTTDKIRELHYIFSCASKISIVTHMKPDGDAIGSSTALYHVLKSYGKRASIVVADPIPGNIDFLITEDMVQDMCIYNSEPEKAKNALVCSDLIICLDFNAFHRTGSLEDFLSGSDAKKILIDHHLAPDLDQFSIAFSVQDISSASELLYYILMQLPHIGNDARNLPHKAAISLLTGMTTDTNNFMNSVYPSTLRMASALLEAGVDRDAIVQNLYFRFKESRIRLQGLILDKIMKLTPDGVAFIILDSETLDKYGVEEGDTEGFVNIPLSIRNVVMSILIKEDSGKARVSIRSKKGISANRCARLHFNGGGHENAAGGKLRIPEDIENISLAEEYIRTHTHIFITEENEQN